MEHLYITDVIYFEGMYVYTFKMLTKLYLLISFNKVHDATVGQHENI
jgi:hypothetical protein